MVLLSFLKVYFFLLCVKVSKLMLIVGMVEGVLLRFFFCCVWVKLCCVVIVWSFLSISVFLIFFGFNNNSCIFVILIVIEKVIDKKFKC